MASLTDKQRAALLSPINEGRVQMLRGMAHLEAWDVRRYLIRIFGLGGWDFQVMETELVHTSVTERPKKDKDGRQYMAYLHTVVYRVTGRLILKDETGEVIAAYDDGAAGDAINQPSVGDAHDMALKTAMSQAIKRCAVNLGDQFGLSLYNNGAAEAVVKWSLIPDEGDYIRESEDAPVAAPEFHPGAEAQGLMASVNAAAHQGAAGRVWSRVVDAFKAGAIDEAEANWLRARAGERAPELPPDPDVQDATETTPQDTPAALEGELIETGAQQ
ncbi:Rad52/Rad22 family DNA repair protein [Glycomyces arizonensis]|uniref:Rad52/Rad22 family DNA repair protein n=1 Tax=Glycomyces arizonensis TaxID=256035 RepID=UPI0003F96597|nr:Rad52/Rad22 family DNA repair protein [Glycomyces arizonensis]